MRITQGDSFCKLMSFCFDIVYIRRRLHFASDAILVLPVFCITSPFYVLQSVVNSYRDIAKPFVDVCSAVIMCTAFCPEVCGEDPEYEISSLSNFMGDDEEKMLPLLVLA